MSGATATATLQIKAVMESNDVISNVNTIQKALKQLKMPKDMTKNAESQLEEIVTLTKEYQNLLEKPNKSNADLRQLDQLEKKIQDAHTRAISFMKDMDFSRINTNDIHTEQIDKMIAKLEKAQEKLKEIGRNKMNTKGINDQMAVLDASIGAKSGKNSKSRERLNNIKESINNGDIKQTLHLLEELQAKNNSLAGRKENPIKWADQAKPAIAELITLFEKLASEESEVDGKTAALKSEIAGLVSGIAQMRSNEIEKMASGMDEVASGLSHARDEANSFNSAMNGAARSQTEMQQQVQNLQMQIKNYFGLDEIFRSIGRLASEAMDTVKELDAAMTETAVVTNFSVEDMWGMLPTYTKHANELGSTIADVYNAATLYYQQGLTTSQSMALADETLKMARIGGIEAAEATDMMTAALRGFNMEINKTSAQRVNDVYSKLAAITAADTKEIGSAMERTASIASSANMDFETTSAFLSQMIETTREAPENLGTAMKTIIARFQEMKVDPTKLVDSEGEAMDFNRVDKALKTIGVSLTDEQGQFRDLDDVFIEISSRWDGLTQAQQRYIATIAAGSRQQSRFIAMMQDYDRTMELVNAAQTAEGAGQAQFEKTLESMDSKLNKLKNAWDQFAMGLMNSTFLKTGVDIATGFLGIVEDIISAISQIGIVDPFKGLIKSALTAGAVFGGLLTMSKLLTAAVGKFAGMVLGDEEAAELKGVAGISARKRARKKTGEGLKGDEKEKWDAKQARKEQLETYGKEMAAARKKESEIARQAQLASLRSGEGVQGGNQYKRFAKDIKSQIENESFNINSLDISFKGLNNSVKQQITPEIHKGMTDAFKEAASKSKANIDFENDGLFKATSKQVEREISEGKIRSAAGVYESLGKRYGVDVNQEELLKAAAHSSSPTGAVASNFEKIGSAASNAGQAVQNFAANLIGTPLEPFANGLMLVGQGLENVGMLLGNGVSAVKKFGSKMMETGEAALAGRAKKGGLMAKVLGLGGDLGEEAAKNAGGFKKMVAGIGSSVGQLATKIAPYAGVIAGLGAGLGFLYYTVTENERAFERQSDAAARASQDLDTTKQTLEALNNDLTELSDNDSSLDELVTGTTEWNSKLAEANAHIIEMMKNYETLNEVDEKTGEYKYVKTDETGRMSITQEGQKELKKEYENAVSLASANNAIQNALLNNMKDIQSDEYRSNKVAMSVGSVGGRSDLGMSVGTKKEYKTSRLQNENVKQMNEAREKQSWKTGIGEVINKLKLPNQKTVENILAGQKDQLMRQNEVDLFESDESIEKEYAKLMKYERTGEGKFKDAQGNELEIDADVIKEQLPELRTLADMQDNAESISSAINKMDSSFSDYAEKENATIDSKILSNILSDNSETTADQIQAVMDGGSDSVLGKYIDSLRNSQNKDDWKMLERLTGKKEGEIDSVSKFNDALDEYEEALKTHAQGLIKQQGENIAATAGLLKNSGLSNDKIGSWTNGKNGSTATSFSYEEMGKISKIGDQIGDNLGDEAAAQFADAMTNNLHKETRKKKGKLLDEHMIGVAARERIQEELSDIDFSNSLQVVEAFNGLSETIGGAGAKGAREYGKAFKDSFEYDEQMSSALQQTLTSDDLAESLKNIKLDETAGKYTAQSIKEAAESSASLSTYLEESKMSAGTFADIMNSMGDAELDLSDLTPGFVAFANAMDQVSNTTSNALYNIQKFNAGDDLGAVDDFSKNALEAINGMKEAGEWGNTQMANYFDHFITGKGKKTFDEVAAELGSYKKAYSQFKGRLNEVLTDDGSFDTEKLKKTINFSEGTEKALKKLQKRYNLTKEAADEALTAIVNKSPTAKLKLQEADAAKGFRKFLKDGQKLGEKYGVVKTNKEGKEITDATGKTQYESIINAKDLLTIGRSVKGDAAKSFWAGVSGEIGKEATEELENLSKQYQKGTKTLEQYNKETNNVIKGLKTDNLITTNAESSNEEIGKEYERVFGKGEKQGDFLEKSEENKNYYDLEKAFEGFTMAAGGDKNVAESAFKEYISQKGYEDKTFEYQGQTMTGQELIDEGIIDKMASITDTNQWKTVGETIASSFAETLEMRTRSDGTTEFVTKSTANAEDFSKGTEINQKGSLYKWLKEDGSGALKGILGLSPDEEQRDNRKLVSDFIQQVSTGKFEKEGKVSQTDMFETWKKIIQESGGEGLAVNTKKDTDDAEKINKYDTDYAEALSRSIIDKNNDPSVKMLNENIDYLAHLGSRDDLNEKTQMNLLNGYLQEIAPQFAKLEPEEQSEAIANIADKFKGVENLTPEALASAISSGLHLTGENGPATAEELGIGGKEGEITFKEDKLLSNIENLKPTIEGNLKIVNISMGTTARGQNNSHYGTMARGSSSHGYTIPGRPTLTGEEGEELVWEPKRNEAYMVGSNGPQFANISKDAVVWNAKQTKRIKKNSGVGSFGLGAKGIKSFGTMALGADPIGSKKGEGSATVSGTITINAIAKITKTTPKTIPVNADLKIDATKGGDNGGIIDKVKQMLGIKAENKYEIPVTGKVTEVKSPEKDSVKPINVPGKVTSAKPKKGLKMSGSVKATAKVNKITKGKKVSGEPVTVKAKASVGSVDTKGIQGAQGEIKGLQKEASSSQEMTVNANTHPAMNMVNTLISAINSKTATVKVSASPSSLDVPVKLVYDGSWSKTITFKKAAEGMNYKLYNSYAGGTLGSKKGLTLTGEEGYEVVWMPGQNKSMIVGMKGPQMVNLPPDAVVWPHDQSKKILKNNKGIPTGTHAKGTKERKKAKKGYKAGVTTKEGREANFFGIVAAIESSEKKIEKWSKTIDKAKDAMDRYSKQVGNSTAKIDKEIGKQAKYLAKQLAEANTELKNAKKATAKINNSQKKIAVSYDLDSAKNSPSKEFRIKQGSLVNRSKKTGELSINEKYIRSLAKRKGKTAFQVNQIIEQLRSEAQSLVDDYNGHIESSKDVQDEVKQKQQDLRDSIKEMFYDFERSLTKIKKLQDQIATTNSFESIITSAQNLLESQIKAGYKTGAASVKEYMSAMQDSLTNARLLAQRQSNLIGASITNIKTNISTSDEKTRYNNAVSARKTAKKKYGEDSDQYQKALSAEEYYKNEYEKAKLGSQYVFVTRDSNGAIQVNFDEAALGEKWGKGSENYNAVVEYYDKVLQSVQDMNQAYADLRESIAGQYQKLTDTYSEMDGFAKTIISGMEENEQETIDSLKTLNDSLKDAFSDLIDSVRKELEKQRREEQNKKTEEDISDKMNRLAMLRADTAGSNAAEIAKLEKEITDATGDYEDSLEDQLLDRLQDDADEAAEQRERQISILEDQLEYTKAIGQYVTKAEDLVRKYMNGTATAEEKAEFRNYYMLGQNGKDPMTIWGKEVAKGEFEFASMKMLSFGETIANITKTIKELNKILKASPTYGSGGIGNNISSRITQALAEGNNKTIGDVLKEMKKGGTKAKDLLGKKYTDKKGNTKTVGLKDLKSAGYSNSDLRAAGATVSQMKGLGVTSAKDLKKAGYSAKQLKQAGYSAKQLKQAGYSNKEIMNAGYSTRELLRNGYTGRQIQSTTGKSGASIEKAVNEGIKAGDKGVSKSDLGGVSKTIDTNGKKKGGKTTAHFNSSGKRLVAAKGSTLYFYDPKNTKKATSKITIDKLKAKTAKANKAEARQAIEYAIKHKKPGSKINKNMKGLINAVGISGKTYKLSNGHTGSINNDGTIHYDVGTSHVSKWDAVKGNIKKIEWDKEKFRKKAKDKQVGREYAQVNNARKKKKYSHFLSGGLADYTGPAWLDGTPSKPELVLNATDTKNFMALKDVLAEAEKHGAFSSNTSDSQGDTVFDININVDKIDSDYDVDQVAKRVEKIITTKAKSRNVTVVGRSR